MARVGLEGKPEPGGTLDERAGVVPVRLATRGRRPPLARTTTAPCGDRREIMGSLARLERCSAGLEARLTDFAPPSPTDAASRSSHGHESVGLLGKRLYTVRE